MGPPVDLPHTAIFLPSVADSLDLLHGWGGVYLLAMAAAMALAVLYELWPLFRLQRAPRNPLTAGRCLLEGVIESGAETSPVVVQIEQERKRRYKLPDRWLERSRRVELVPFVLRLDDGRRVRVVPRDQQVTLLCKLRKPSEYSFNTRTLTAKVSICERVLVKGDLVVPPAPTAADPYRGDGEPSPGPELRPLPGAPLWIAVEREARTMMIGAACFYATLMLMLGATCFVTQRSRELRELRAFAEQGRVVDAKVIDVRVSPLPVIIRAVLPNGWTVASRVNRSVAGFVRPGSTVKWTYLPSDVSVNSPGVFERDQPSVVVLVFGAWMAWLAAMWIYWSSYRPWYRRFEVNQSSLW